MNDKTTQWTNKWITKYLYLQCLYTSSSVESATVQICTVINLSDLAVHWHTINELHMVTTSIF